MEHSHVSGPKPSEGNRAVPGAPAPGAVVQDEHGRPVRLAELWANAPRATVLVFLREFG
jgi:hypothetical protein